MNYSEAACCKLNVIRAERSVELSVKGIENSVFGWQHWKVRHIVNQTISDTFLTLAKCTS